LSSHSRSAEKENNTMTDKSDRTPGDDAVLNAIEAAKMAAFNTEFVGEPPDTTGIPPWKQVSARPTIADLEFELAALDEWLKRLIETLPEGDQS
jgi:hypothetical protein